MALRLPSSAFKILEIVGLVLKWTGEDHSKLAPENSVRKDGLLSISLANAERL